MHGFANTATIKPNGDGNTIEGDITNVRDITITGVMVVPLGPLAEEHLSGSWFVLNLPRCSFAQTRSDPIRAASKD